MLWGRDEHGLLRPLPYQHLLLFTTMNPEPAHPYGVSLFRGMPFLAEILVKIYNTIGINWEAPILDSQIPVRQILEQLVAKTGLPPFLLGLSWSTTERMSVQQADLLTSELWALRRMVEPAMEKVCRTFLALEGLDDRFQIIWDDISLQDITQQAQAQLYQAQAENYRAEAARKEE